jgi:phenylacetic acid degradation operon negative regulatory protein
MPGTPENSLVAALAAEFSSRKPMRTGSLITTIYGDVVAPRGGTLWLGSLLPLLHAFSINDSQARTAMSRLVDDQWLSANRIGRKSYYTLTDVGRARFHEATRRIYAGAPSVWSGDFCIVIVPGGPNVQRDQLRKELGWIGFGTLSAGILVHPDPDEAALGNVLSRATKTADRPVVIRGVNDPTNSATALAQMVEDCWSLQDLSDDYRAFVERFSPLGQALSEDTPLSTWDCLRARVMLIHEYRRIILRDPLLPTQLLPKDWAGTHARELAREIYQQIVPSSEQSVAMDFEREDGPLPRAEAAFWQRFGGLKG